MTVVLEFDGGPLDGQTITLPQESLVGEVLICIPAKAEGDGDIWTDQILHRYSLCHSSMVEGQDCRADFMGHTSAVRKTISAMHAFLNPSAPSPPAP
jgi:hypothetical protein